MPSRKRPAAGAPADAARPSRYSSELARTICDAIAGGEPLAAVCERPGRPDRHTLSRWLKTNQDFQAAYACALEVVADRYAAEIIALADGTGGDAAEPATGKRDSADTVARLKLRIDTRKWLMAKLAPNKYGDRAVAKATAAQPLNIHELSDEELDEIDAAGGDE